MIIIVALYQWQAFPLHNLPCIAVIPRKGNNAVNTFKKYTATMARHEGYIFLPVAFTFIYEKKDVSERTVFPI